MKSILTHTFAFMSGGMTGIVVGTVVGFFVGVVACAKSEERKAADKKAYQSRKEESEE